MKVDTRTRNRLLLLAALGAAGYVGWRKWSASRAGAGQGQPTYPQRSHPKLRQAHKKLAEHGIHVDERLTDPAYVALKAGHTLRQLRNATPQQREEQVARWARQGAEWLAVEYRAGNLKHLAGDLASSLLNQRVRERGRKS